MGKLHWSIYWSNGTRNCVFGVVPRQNSKWQTIRFEHWTNIQCEFILSHIFSLLLFVKKLLSAKRIAERFASHNLFNKKILLVRLCVCVCIWLPEDNSDGFIRILNNSIQYSILMEINGKKIKLSWTIFTWTLKQYFFRLIVI